MMVDLRSIMQKRGTSRLPQTAVVSNARDRLHCIAALTEQAARAAP
jgi:chemotaxis regulatin CheY-phosphate phosphatase CheZ